MFNGVKIKYLSFNLPYAVLMVHINFLGVLSCFLVNINILPCS